MSAECKLAAVAVAVVAFVALSKCSSYAQAVCGRRLDVISVMDKKYHEAPRAMGFPRDGTLIEVYTSPTGTFTMLASMTNGLSCIVASGTGFEFVPEIIAGERL